MKKLLPVLIVLFVTELSFSQYFEIPIKVSDGSSSDTLRLGFDPTATNGIDAHLNEFELPPSPPTGIFDARIFSDSLHIPLGQGVKRDYRPGGYPLRITSYYKVKYQASSGSTSIRLSILRFPLLPPALTELKIQDVFGGIVVNTVFTAPDTGSVLITNLNVDKLVITLKVYDPSPVELNQFWSTTVNNDVYLSWLTGSEMNNRGFEVQRKKDIEEEWSFIGFVAGAVNSNELKEYEYADQSLNQGSYNYRLKQIDLNGNYEYFLLNEVVNIGRPNKFALFQNYPNPFNPTTTISYQLSKPGLANMSLYDSRGKLVQVLLNEFRNAGTYEFELDAGSLSSGVYYYSLLTNGDRMTKSFVFLK